MARLTVVETPEGFDIQRLEGRTACLLIDAGRPGDAVPARFYLPFHPAGGLPRAVAFGVAFLIGLGFDPSDVVGGAGALLGVNQFTGGTHE